MPIKNLLITVLLLAVTLPISAETTISPHGAIIRGDASSPSIALVFTGDEYANSGETILSTLQQRRIHAAFFLTGKFYRNPEFQTLISKLAADGHYLGAHSDMHLLYCDWTRRDSTLVSRDTFRRDLLANYAEMERFGTTAADAPFYLPPYEWYNRDISAWTAELGLTLINFTPGTLSHADYTIPSAANYRSSESILRSILDREAASGLNGFILLTHIGTHPERTDLLADRLGELLDELNSRGYSFVRIDSLPGLSVQP